MRGREFAGVMDELGDGVEGYVVGDRGATGGVGTLLVQLASAAGAEVIADLDGAVRSVAPDGVDPAVHLSGDPVAIAALVKDAGVLVDEVAGFEAYGRQTLGNIVAVMD